MDGEDSSYALPTRASYTQEINDRGGQEKTLLSLIRLRRFSPDRTMRLVFPLKRNAKKPTKILQATWVSPSATFYFVTPCH